MQTSLVIFVALLAVGTSIPTHTAVSDADKAKNGLLKLMNLGFGMVDSLKKSTTGQAYQLGENMGKHIADDQEKESHSVNTKLEAAREGMKDSVRDATSILQEGVHEVRGIADDKGIQQALKDVAKPIVNNPQFGYFSSLLEENLQKGEGFFGKTFDAFQTQAASNEASKTAGNFMAAFKKSFEMGQEIEQKKQLNRLEKHEKTELSQAEHEDILQAKANRLIEKTTKLAEVALDNVPETIDEAAKAAEKADRLV